MDASVLHDPRFDPTPQHIGARRMLARLPSHRRRAVGRQVRTLKHAVVRAHLLDVPKPKAIDAREVARSQLGLPYAITGCRCNTGYCWARDCSGLICFARNTMGAPYICTSSFAFAEMGRQFGLFIPEDEAIHTPWAYGIRCAFCDPNGNGSNGHIVGMEGDGEFTIEEGGHATGCYRGHATGRNFDAWMLDPFLDYTPVDQPPPARKAEDVIVIPCTNKPKHPTGNKPHATFVEPNPISAPSGGVLLRWGASIAGDMVVDATTRLWTPIVREAGRTWITMYARRDGSGVVLVDNLGHTIEDDRGHWS